MYRVSAEPLGESCAVRSHSTRSVALPCSWRGTVGESLGCEVRGGGVFYRGYGYNLELNSANRSVKSPWCRFLEHEFR
jgi:hypothetical protein